MMVTRRGEEHGARWGRAPLAVALALALAGCAKREGGNQKSGAPAPSAAPPAAETAQADVEINPRLLRRFQPLTEPLEAEKTPVAAAKVALGRQLFYDARLSKAGDISCNTCHDLETYGVDRKPTSTGHKGQRGIRNAPTVYNTAGHFVQFWDGRAPTLEEQAKGPILDPVEMAMDSGAEVIARLKAIPEYAGPFRDAFPVEADPITLESMAAAIGAFERRLVTPSRWDKFLLGDKNALTRLEKEGLKEFLNAGCMVCHTGTLVGASTFERVGAVKPWPNQADKGRMAVTHRPEDAMMFKVPSLRNVAKTGPYFHDGSAATLDDAVQMMGRHQLGIELAPEEIRPIVAWLEALTGEIPRELIKRPHLPGEKGDGR